MQKMLFAEITFDMTDTYMEKKKDNEKADVRKKRSTTSNR